MTSTDRDTLTTRRRLPRRQFLRGGLVLTGTLVVGGLLQACGGSGQAPPNPPTAAPKPTDAPKPTEAAKPAAPAATTAPAAPAAQPAATQAAPAAAAKPTEAAKPAAPAAAAGTPKKGGILVVGATDEAADLDPHWQNALARQQRTQNIYSYLVQADKDLRIQPDLAEKWELSPDGKTYTFSLRKGVKFHNGRELTSEDVKYSIERIRDPNKASQGKALMASIDGVDTSDKYVAKITLKEPDSGLLAAFASAWGAIVAKEEVDKAGGNLNKADGGSGPYMIEEWVPNQALKLKKFPDYYDKNVGFVDGITFQVIPEESAIIAQLRSGSVHMTLLKDNKNYQVVKDVPNLDAIRGTRLGFDYLDIDNQREPFNKIEVRQALQAALDRDEFLAVCTSGLGTLISPVPPALKDYTLDPKSFPEYKQDLNKAKELLAKAGVANGFRTSIDIIPQFATMVTGSQVLADQLKKIGIELEIKQYEYGVWLDRFNTHQFDMAWNVTGGNADPDPLLRSRLHSKTGSNQNNSTDTEIDKLLDEGKLITDLAKRKEHYANTQKVLVQKVPQVWMFSSDLIHVMKKTVKGYESHPSSFFQGLTTAWLDG
jgi:peptide/nickel transport system substrate-binding protein